MKRPVTLAHVPRDIRNFTELQVSFGSWCARVPNICVSCNSNRGLSAVFGRVVGNSVNFYVISANSASAFDFLREVYGSNLYHLHFSLLAYWFLGVQCYALLWGVYVSFISFIPSAVPILSLYRIRLMSNMALPFNKKHTCSQSVLVGEPRLHPTSQCARCILKR